MGPKLPEVGAGAEGKQVPGTVEGLEGTARVEADAKPRSKGAPRVQGMDSPKLPEVGAGAEGKQGVAQGCDVAGRMAHGRGLACGGLSGCRDRWTAHRRWTR